MTRQGFYIGVTLAFLIISIPETISIWLHRPFLIDRMNVPWLKFLLILFICGIESYLVKNRVASVAGMLASVLLFFGMQYKIMHWPRAEEIIILSIGIIFVSVLIGTWLEKRKAILDLLLLFFVGQRVAIIILDPSTTRWWIDVITCDVVALIGVFSLYRIYKTPKKPKYF